MSPRATAAVCLVALAAAPTGAAAQPTDLFTKAVEVRVVNVDVHVTDRKGRPITGLGKEDFELYVDGQRVEIGYFYATRERRAASKAPAETLSPPPGVADRPTGSVVAADATDNLLVVLYLDHNWLRLSDRLRLLDDLEGFVAAQTAGAVRFLVVTYGPGLALRSPITSDLGAVRQALDDLGEVPTHGDDTARERSATFDDIITAYKTFEDTPFCSPCDCGFDMMLGIWEAFAQRVTHRMQVSAGGLSDLLAALAGLPDRKAVLYVAGGLEQRPALDVLQYIGELCPERERDVQTRMLQHDASRSLLDLGALANASRATFYPLDSGGLRGESSATVQWESFKFRPSGLVTRIERENYQSSLQILASETGGRAIFNANQPLEELRGLEDDFYQVYSLGLEPQGEADGRKHTVRVALRDPPKGADLRYRRSFIDRPFEERLAARAVTALTFAEERNPLAVEASLGPPTAIARNVIGLPVHIAVRPERLTLAPRPEGGASGRVRVFLAAIAPDGARTALREKFFDVDASSPATGMRRIVVTINLEPGDYRVAVGVRDEIGGETSYLILDTTDPSDRIADAPPAADG